MRVDACDDDDDDADDDDNDDDDDDDDDNNNDVIQNFVFAWMWWHLDNFFV